MNRCAECNKFRKWEDLECVSFTPDYEDGSGWHSENSVYECKLCIEENHGVEDYPAQDGGLLSW